MAIDPDKQGEPTRDTPGNTGLVFLVSSLFTCRDAGRPSDVRAADQISRVLADLHRVAKPMTCDHGRERLADSCGKRGGFDQLLTSQISRKPGDFAVAALLLPGSHGPRSSGDSTDFPRRGHLVLLPNQWWRLARSLEDSARLRENRLGGSVPAPRPGGAPVHSQGRKPLGQVGRKPDFPKPCKGGRFPH